MPRSKKKRRRNNGANENATNTFDMLGIDELVHIFEFLQPENIMLARLTKKMKDAAMMTKVPLTTNRCDIFTVDCPQKFNAMSAMSTALPNLQQIHVCKKKRRFRRYSDGNDPDPVLQVAADIEILSSFRNLRELKIDGLWILNGRYPALFQFPLLQKLTITNCDSFEWDLGMLSGLRSLKELECKDGFITGNVSSLRSLKETLVKVHLAGGWRVQGNFMDLADFPHLENLDLTYTAVRGDMRDIHNLDFLSLKKLSLSSEIYGAEEYKFEHISDAADVAATVSLFMKHRPAINFKCWYATLSSDSPDWYEESPNLIEFPCPPFYIELVKAGPRWGWRWKDRRPYFTSLDINPCEVNWIDSEPNKNSSEYEQYVEELKEITKDLRVYKGFHQPPSEDEYLRIVKEEYDREEYEEYEASDDECHSASWGYY